MIYRFPRVGSSLARFSALLRINALPGFQPAVTCGHFCGSPSASPFSPTLLAISSVGIIQEGDGRPVFQRHGTCSEV